ncbi:hypothetical protein HI914_00881 [Erysiphe necator]|uniref:DUF7137 domain-containing protein n=1 Tax=Uncinula necator TaxID=52586 RepID=A0A0B1P4Q0_UNCNE|nr:hypothetical protein HI914_00881 [Erysiphe necator]KHJ31906.1 hypothetical protein EV44_g0464 [Erysiphe necator]
MKASVCLQLYWIFLLSTSNIVTAWPWPAILPPLNKILARQENNNNDDNQPAAPTPAQSSIQTSGKAQPMPTSAGNQKETSTISNGNAGTITGLPSETQSGDDSGSMTTTSGPTSFDARLPAGGVSMQTPAISLGQQYFKIGDYVTFGWNYTSLEATPTAVNVMATCAANKQLYTIQMNQTVANNTGLVVWDTGKYQATAVQNPLLTQTYTLIIYDSDSSISAVAQPGLLAVYNQYTFGMYSPQPYTPLGDFKCVTCNGALSEKERSVLSLVFGMSIITFLSFTYFVRDFGVIW